jgi:molecular chaperone GrpE
MQPHKPVPPYRPAETVKANPHSPAPSPKEEGSNSAASLKDVEALLAEAKELIKPPAEPPPAAAGEAQACPDPQVPPGLHAGDVKACPTEAGAQAAPPAGPQAAPPAGSQAGPAATGGTEAPPAEAGTQAVPQAESAIDLAAALTDMEARLAKVEKRATEQHDALLRAKAETENVRRRAQEDTAKASKFAAEKFAGAMLPVKDSLEAALATEGQTLETLREGVELTLRQLVAAFEGANLAEENPLGQKFDPNKHQAIGTVESEAEPNTVVKVLQKGYLLHGRVIRPAIVMVAIAAKAKA